MEAFDTPNQTPGEFFDRLTIVLRKAYYLPNEQDRLTYWFKYEAMCKSLPSELNKDVSSLVFALMMVNSEIWHLEADIRKGKEGQLGEAEVGRRAIAIRKINATRVYLVNKINKIYDIEEEEVKADHVSEVQ